MGNLLNKQKIRLAEIANALFGGPDWSPAYAVALAGRRTSDPLLAKQVKRLGVKDWLLVIITLMWGSVHNTRMLGYTVIWIKKEPHMQVLRGEYQRLSSELVKTN